MNRIKNLWIITLITLAMVGCQKDQELTSEQSTNATTILSNHTHTNGRNCASKAYLAERMQDPIFKAKYEERKNAFERVRRSNIASSRSACTSPTVLPVAVHFQGISNPNKSCLTNLAQQQIQILNADIQGKNSDMVQWTNSASSNFSNISEGSLCVAFQIATQNHPTGYGLTNGQPAITFNQTNGDQVNKWSGYINIYVNDADGNLGYAPLGGAGDGDGVVISKDAFGAGAGCNGVQPESPFDLGRTLVHEMGHYLNLDHLWGDGGCSSDDLVSDTPSQTDANEGCPSSNTSSCGSRDLHMNYMDYANDACMYMFTAGQASRMNNWLNSGLKNRLKTNVLSGGTTTGGTTTGGTGTGGGTTTGGGTSNDVCEAPTSSSVTKINDTDINVTWSTVSGANRYQIQYRPQGGGWTRKAAATPQKRINGLTPGTTYQYRVRARCTDGWTSYSSIKSYALPATNSGGNTGGTTGNTGTSRITVKVTLDDYGSETTFAIEDGDGSVVKSWGSFADNKAGTTITRNIDLPTGIYTFVIFDDYGDGICCSEGAGKWQLLKDGNSIKTSNGKFGYWEEYDFAVGGARLSGPAHRVDPQNAVALAKKKKH